MGVTRQYPPSTEIQHGERYRELTFDRQLYLGRQLSLVEGSL